MIWRCDLVPQYKLYEKEIKDAMERVFLSGRYTLSNEVDSFEKEFAKYVGVKYAIGVGNGTDALILSMRVLNIGPGDEVITTPFTAIPTVSAIIAIGAKPVFVDVCEDTFLMDIKKIEQVITSKTKAIIPVALFGNMVDIIKLKSYVGKIPIIEDACQAHGSEIDGLRAGSLGDLGAFSFYPTKNLGAIGDGGAIVTNNKEYYDKLRLLRVYGMTDYNHIIINGINSRLDELQAAILRVKLRYLDEMNSKRNVIAKTYIRNLNRKLFIHQRIPENVFSNYHQFVSRLKINRDGFVEYLNDNEIQTNIYYLLPLHLQEANKYLKYRKGSFPVAERLCDEVIALTMYSELAEEPLQFVIEKINDYA